MTTQYKRLFAWNDWANREALASCNTAKNAESSLKVISHIIAAEHLWHDRISNAPSPMPVWPSLSHQQALSELDKLRDKWERYLAKLTEEEIARSISYKTTKGDSFANSVGDILTHVLYHGSHHRGQIAREVRREGGTPAMTDFIHAVRSGRLGL